MAVAGACSGVGPAYLALFAEAQIDAAIRHGMPPAKAGASWSRRRWPATAELLAANAGDTLAVRRAVTSPGGSTARGLAALERGGVRAALHDAMDDVVGALMQVRAATSPTSSRRSSSVYTLCVLAYDRRCRSCSRSGMRMPYSRPLNAVMDFLRDVDRARSCASSAGSGSSSGRST